MTVTDQRLFRLDIPTMVSFHKCNEMLGTVASSVPREQFFCEIDREAKDANGPHWFGYRCIVKDPASGVSLYLHFGFIFLPSTKVGLMVELDKNSNRAIYKTISQHVSASADYDLNKEEDDYLKLFLPDRRLKELMEETRAQRQAEMIRAYFIACCQAYLQAGREGNR